MENSFYFENDHVLLRGDCDYNNILRYITVRLLNRAAIQKHIEELMRLHAKYMEKPDIFLEKLRTNAEIIPPYVSNSIKMPFIHTKLTSLVKDEEIPNVSHDSFSFERGRIKSENKPETFNRLWTYEEQRRLEELLIKYPPETIEMRRFTKIAKELGNRTPLQVSSRVQKYFRKLHEIGLPIPGRIPKSRKSNVKSINKHRQRSSTFFPVYKVPVNIPEEDYCVGAELCDDNDVKENNIDENILKSKHSWALKMLKVLRTKSKSLKTSALNKCELCHVLLKNCCIWKCISCNTRQMICSECIIQRLLSYNFEHLLHNVIIEDSIKC